MTRRQLTILTDRGFLADWDHRRGMPMFNRKQENAATWWTIKDAKSIAESMIRFQGCVFATVFDGEIPLYLANQ